MSIPISPNMGLLEPVIGVNSGLDWETSINANSATIDQHTHIPGQGIQITPAGLNINSDLSFLGNNGVFIRSSRFQVQSAAISGPLDLSCAYAAGPGGDLYFNDGSGNQIQMTSGGVVNATSSGISSGSATCSFVSSVLVVNADNSNATPANVQMGSALLGLNSPGSAFLTLSPPSALSAGAYQLFLPVIPAQTNSMTIDTSGNMGSITWDAVGQNMSSVGANAIGVSMNATGSNAVRSSSSRTLNSGSIGEVATAGSSGNFSTNSTTFVAVTNLTVSLVTAGYKPIMIQIQSDAANANSTLYSSEGQWRIINGSGGTVATGSFSSPIPGISIIDTSTIAGGGGTLEYEFQVLNQNGGSNYTFVLYCNILAYEIS